jgi:hypothetical protein
MRLVCAEATSLQEEPVRCLVDGVNPSFLAFSDVSDHNAVIRFSDQGEHK